MYGQMGARGPCVWQRRCFDLWENLVVESWVLVEVWWCEYVPICFVDRHVFTCVTIRSQSQHIAIRDHDHHIML